MPDKPRQDVSADANVAAAMTPSKSFSREVKERMDAWLNEDEPGPEPVESDGEPEEVEEEPVEEPAGELEEELEDEPVEEPATEAAEEALAEAAEEEIEAAAEEEPGEEIEEPSTPTEDDGEPRPPKPYSVKDGEEDFEVPDSLAITYRADGKEQTRPLDEVVKYAQLGENFDRRSQELAQDKRDSEAALKGHYEKLDGQYKEAWQSLMQTVQRIGTDPDYRQELVDEFERLSSNPEELQLRLRAQRAEELEKWYNDRMTQDQQAFSQKVWRTVDSIIHKSLSDYNEGLRDRTADRIRDRFHKAYQSKGREVLSDRFIRALVKEERSVIDATVKEAREAALKDIEPQVKKANLEQKVEKQNKITDEAIKKDKVGRTSPKPSGPAPAAEKKTKITSAKDASKALKEWAAS